jgi:serine/threonine protein kinase
VLYILLSGIPPFYEEDNFALFEKIKNVEYDFNDPIWKSVSKDAKDIIKRLLVADPSKRMTCEELLAHDWIKKSSEQASNENVLAKMKNWNSKRKMVL